MADGPSPASSPLRNRNFRAFLGARALASLSSLMLTVAVGWHVYALTGSAFALGMVGLAQFLPALLFALPGGLAADRIERRSILLAGTCLQVVVALLLLSISLVAGAGAGWIFPVVALIGVGQAFLGPASQSLVPFLVPREDFPRAVAWNSSTFQVATIAGPAVGGLLYAFGPTCVYAVCAGCYVCSFFLMLSMRARLRVAAAAKPGFEGILTGLRFVFSRPTILGAISLDLFAVLFGGATALLPIYARDILHTGPWGLGLLRSAPAVGAGIMAMVLAQRPLARSAGPRMFACVALFGVMTIVFGLSRSFFLSLAALAVLGAADMVSVVVRQTLVQINTPDENRGRVSAVNSIFIGASNQLGEFESGVTASWLGAVPAAVLGGIGTIVVVLLWAGLFPTLRRADQLVAEQRSGNLHRADMRKYEHNGVSQKFTVGKTNTGLGLFTKVPISKGKLVVEYTGRLLPAEDAYRKGGRYLFEVNSRWIIDGAGRENVSRYINHSSRPNCEPRTRGKKVLIYARRNIKPGEELSYDYGKEYFDDIIRPMGCRCDHCAGGKPGKKAR